MTEQEYRELEPLYDRAKTECAAWPDPIFTTHVQRTYMLGYNRARRLLESLEQYGVLKMNRDGSFRRTQRIGNGDA